MSEFKFVITGTAGVGKTTAICALSDVPPVATDADTTDDLSIIKSTTTVAFDFGEVVLEDGARVRIYGTPGQERFRHMWEIIAEGALGLIILVDNSRPDPLDDLMIYMSNFKQLIEDTGVVIGVTRCNGSDRVSIDDYYSFLERRDMFCPVIEADPRSREDMVVLMDALMAMLEYA